MVNFLLVPNKMDIQLVKKPASRSEKPASIVNFYQKPFKITKLSSLTTLHLSKQVLWPYKRAALYWCYWLEKVAVFRLKTGFWPFLCHHSRSFWSCRSGKKQIEIVMEQFTHYQGGTWCVLTLLGPATFLPTKTEYMALIYGDWGFQKCIYEPYWLTS